MSTDQRPRLRLVRDDERAPRRRDLVRRALAAVAVSQLALGVAQIAGVHLLDAVSGEHVRNESAAWNVALGLALLGVARAGRCSPAVLAVLTAFVAMLTVLTVTDLLAGQVGLARLSTHTSLLVGFFLVVRLTRRSTPVEEMSPGRGTPPDRAATNESQTSQRNGLHAHKQAGDDRPDRHVRHPRPDRLRR
ncbi:hypothetical protein [Actinoplanes sp. NPDC049265]|uniref:hypothetical protein n=1 Tax=Actinoplanes sp. NPDC049265 TaxID=3363902 RepID=UPI003712EDA1